MMTVKKGNCGIDDRKREKKKKRENLEVIWRRSSESDVMITKSVRALSLCFCEQPGQKLPLFSVIFCFDKVKSKLLVMKEYPLFFQSGKGCTCEVELLR